MKMFARNGAGAFVGGVLGPSPGYIVVLPNLLELDETEFFSACRQYLFAGESMPPPSWAGGVRLPGQSEAAERVSAAERQVEQSQAQLKAAVEELSSLANYKKLLFEKGKAHLEPAVRKALDDLGFATTPSEDIPGTNYEIDGRTTVGSSRAMLEIKGSKKQILLDEFSPFVIKILADLQQSKKTSKGILVGNGLCLEPPENRLGEKIFTPHVLGAAKQNSIALVNSVELYWLVIGVLEQKVKDCDSVREAILAASGYVDLRPYCGPSPFKSPGRTV